MRSIVIRSMRSPDETHWSKGRTVLLDLRNIVVEVVGQSLRFTMRI